MSVGMTNLRTSNNTASVDIHFSSAGFQLAVKWERSSIEIPAKKNLFCLPLVRLSIMQSCQFWERSWSGNGLFVEGEAWVCNTVAV